ncbi:MAG TPA: gamma-glutamyltransferase, partial [Burkholderiaceae bacterium]|nr:gamma-glutamyltransferase [Burkholderiaceae bacterium]
DGARNLVALTVTIEQAFGSGMVVPGWGFLLNNQLTDFHLSPQEPGQPPHPNRMIGGRRTRDTTVGDPAAKGNAAPQGGQRPRSSMSPTLVFKGGKPVLVLGSPGGSRIIQYVAEVLLRVLDHGMGVQTAINAPHHTHMGGRTDLEPPLDQGGLPDRLRALGHQVRIRPQGSGLHAIAIDPGTGMLSGGADPRREGLAMGF